MFLIEKEPDMPKTSSYTEEIANRICERMIEGEDIVTICKDEEMPSRRTVYRWMDEHPEFDTQCARAREGLADFEAHKIAEIATKCTPESAPADRVKLSALQWLASKRAPKKWGEKMEVDAKVELTTNPTDSLFAFLAAVEKTKTDG
jgi:hypothetical protein